MGEETVTLRDPRLAIGCAVNFYLVYPCSRSFIYSSQDVEATWRPSVAEWIKKMDMCTVEFFSAIKKMRYCRLGPGGHYAK